jgi:hypothetical protein
MRLGGRGSRGGSRGGDPRADREARVLPVGGARTSAGVPGDRLAACRVRAPPAGLLASSRHRRHVGSSGQARLPRGAPPRRLVAARQVLGLEPASREGPWRPESRRHGLDPRDEDCLAWTPLGCPGHRLARLVRCGLCLTRRAWLVQAPAWSRPDWITARAGSAGGRSGARAGHTGAAPLVPPVAPAGAPAPLPAAPPAPLPAAPPGAPAGPPPVPPRSARASRGSSRTTGAARLLPCPERRPSSRGPAR